MDSNISKQQDNIVNQRIDLESTSEHTLSEYMQSIGRIIKTDAYVKIDDRSVTENGLSVEGEVVYNVLYMTGDDGYLTSVVFREPFEKTIPNVMTTCGDAGLRIKTTLQSVSAKAVGKRGIEAKAKFGLLAEMFSSNTYDEQDSRLLSPDCETEYLRKDIESVEIKYFDNIRELLSESVEIDEGMPEIKELLSVNAYACVKSISHNEDNAEILGEMKLNCLYEAQTENDTEYVSMQRALPFKVEAEVAQTDYSWTVVANVTVNSVNAEIMTDNYGEQKLIDLAFDLSLSILASKNRENTVFIDMYSTKCGIIPKMCRRKNYTQIGYFEDKISYTDSIKYDMRGISEIICQSLKVSFGTPEIVEDKVYIPTKGVLSILGTKENGTIESQTSMINIKIPCDNIDVEKINGNVRWLNYCDLCSFEAEISGGELVIALTVNESLIALREQILEVVCGYEKQEGEESRRCGFTLYYPDKGESVWEVAKKHRVSCERLIAENSIESDIFDGTTAVILH